MKVKLRRVKYVALTITAFFIFIAARHTAFADSAPEIARQVNNFRSGGYGILTAAVSGNTVIISGDPITDSKLELDLNIDEHVKITWNIPYSGTIDASSGNALISLTGSGVFEVTNKGSIINSGTACSIYSTGETKVSVSGGTVQAAGSGIAISARIIEVSGGIICAEEGYALYIHDPGTATVSGGFLFAYGTGITGTGNVVNNSKALTVKNVGVLSAWNKGVSEKTYIKGTTENLVVFPANSAKWSTDSEQCGIEYADGAFPAFFPIDVLSVLDTGEESFVTVFTFSHVQAITNVNMRKGPGVSYDREGSLQRGEFAEYLSVMITDETGVIWYNIKHPVSGTSAWVSSDYSRLANVDEE
jgi:uncharacterized protein YraI